VGLVLKIGMCEKKTSQMMIMMMMGRGRERERGRGRKSLGEWG